MAAWPEPKGSRVLPETGCLPCLRRDLFRFVRAMQIVLFWAAFSEGGFFCARHYIAIEKTGDLCRLQGRADTGHDGRGVLLRGWSL